MTATATADSTRRGASILLGSCAAAAVVIYVAATVLGGLLDPTYSHLSMHISELTSSRAPNRTLLAGLYVGYNLALVGVGLALRRQPHSGRWLATASWLLVTTGLVGILLVTWFPQDSYGYPTTPAGTGHIILAGVAALTAIAAMLTAGRGFTHETGQPLLGRLSIVAALAMLAAGFVGAVATALDSRYMGLLQRLSIGVFLLWLAAFAWRSPTRSQRQLPVLSFFILAYAWSWAWWWTAAATGVAITEPPGLLLYLLGVFGPLVGAIWVVHREGRAYRREFWRRIWDPRSISVRWWFALLAVAAGPAALSAVGTGLAGVAVLASGLSAGVVAAMVGPALVAGLAEEPGWRGAVSDAWQARSRPVWAATGIGVLWSVWHLPLGFVEGSYFHDLGPGSVRFWLTLLMLVQLGVLLVWLANGSGGSILLAVLAHAGFNVAMGLVAGSTTRDVVAFFVLTAAALLVIIVTKGRLGLAVAEVREQPVRSAPQASPDPGEGPASVSLPEHA